MGWARKAPFPPAEKWVGGAWGHPHILMFTYMNSLKKWPPNRLKLLPENRPLNEGKRHPYAFIVLFKNKKKGSCHFQTSNSKCELFIYLFFKPIICTPGAWGGIFHFSKFHDEGSWQPAFDISGSSGHPRRPKFLPDDQNQWAGHPMDVLILCFVH